MARGNVSKTRLLRPPFLFVIAGCLTTLQIAEPFSMSPHLLLARSANQRPPASSHLHVPWPAPRQLPSFRQTRNPFAKSVCMRLDGLSAGLKAARFIMDDKERTALKREVKGKFPLVPSSLVDSTIDEIAQLIEKASPADLRLLLSPGGLGGEREELRDKYAKKLAKRIDLPMLDDRDTATLYGFFIDKIFDELMAADEDFFTPPMDRLMSLESSLEEVRSEVNPVSLLLYRARKHVLKVLLAGAAVGLFFLLPTIYGHFPITKVWAAKFVTATSNFLHNLLVLYFHLPVKA